VVALVIGILFDLLMGRIHAEFVGTGVMSGVALGDGANQMLIDSMMSSVGPAIDANLTMPGPRGLAGPYPAARRRVYDVTI
jgi:hypothetical protein